MKTYICQLLLTIFIFLTTNHIAFCRTLELVTFQYPPYEFEEDGEIKGIAVEIVRAAFKKMNQPIRISIKPWNEGLKQVKEGEADAIFTAYRTAERMEFADYSRKILMAQIVSLFVKKESKISFHGDIKTLRHFKIGVVKNISHGKMFDSAVKEGYLSNLIDDSTDGIENMQRLINGEFDIAVSNKYGAMYILRNLNKMDHVRELTPEIQFVPSYIAFSKKKNLIITRDRFDLEISKMKRSGEYVEIINHFFTKQ